MNAIATTAPTQDDVISVLQNSIYPGAKRESVELVLSYCRVNGIDPMLKPVHIVPTSIKVGDNKWEKRDILMPGIADYRIKAARSGDYGGKSEPEFGPTRTEEVGGLKMSYPEWCRITVYRIVHGEARPFPAKEYWLENYATAGRDTDKPNAMWQKRAYGQLAKCAEAQALRMAFPEFSGGQPTAEEMEGKEISGGTIIEGRAEPTPSRREQINAATPMDQPLKRETLREWMTRFEVETTAAQTPEEASRVLDPAMAMEEFLSSRPAAKAQYDAIRQACIARVWAEPPDDDDEEAPEIRGAERVAAG